MAGDGDEKLKQDVDHKKAEQSTSGSSRYICVHFYDEERHSSLDLGDSKGQNVLQNVRQTRAPVFLKTWHGC